MGFFNKNKYTVTLLIFAAIIFSYRNHKKTEPISSPPEARPAQHRSRPDPESKPVTIAEPPKAPPVVNRTTAPVKPEEKKKQALVLPYVLEGNLAIVQGDIVVGAITDANPPEQGQVNVPEFRLWPSRVIPYHIQPSLSQPDRVTAALALFSATNIQFVPLVKSDPEQVNDQKNAIVFEESDGVCKSYVGQVGGFQPIFLSAGCGPHEIAHEIMHALGFIHEQNRDDRDNYLQVNFDNIDPAFRFNFEKLPPEFMKASGLAKFDYESIMIYPTTMFALSSRPTMQPNSNADQIRPSQGLSPLDIQRINQAYK